MPHEGHRNIIPDHRFCILLHFHVCLRTFKAFATIVALSIDFVLGFLHRSFAMFMFDIPKRPHTISVSRAEFAYYKPIFHAGLLHLCLTAANPGSLPRRFGRQPKTLQNCNRIFLNDSITLTRTTIMMGRKIISKRGVNLSADKVILVLIWVKAQRSLFWIHLTLYSVHDLIKPKVAFCMFPVLWEQALLRSNSIGREEVLLGSPAVAVRYVERCRAAVRL